MSYYQAISQNTIPEVRSNLYALPSNAQISLTIDVDGTQYTRLFSPGGLAWPWYEYGGTGGVEQCSMFDYTNLYADTGDTGSVCWERDALGAYRVRVSLAVPFAIVQMVAADTDLDYLVNFGAVEFVETIDPPEEPEPDEETGDLISHNPFNNLSVLSAPNKLTFCLTPTTNKTALLGLRSGTLIETNSTLQFISSADDNYYNNYSFFSYYIKGPEVNFNIQVPTNNSLFISQDFYFRDIGSFDIRSESPEEVTVTLQNYSDYTPQVLTTFPGDILAVSFNNNILSITNGNGTISTQFYGYDTFLDVVLTCIMQGSYSDDSYLLADINISFDSSIQISPRTTTHVSVINNNNL